MFFRTPGDRFFPVQMTYIIPADSALDGARRGGKNRMGLDLFGINPSNQIV